jgi:predicted dithiol-disulfide oxidoreductase (DUF899 family)
MTLPHVVPREEWLAARKQLLVQEKELSRARDALSAQRRELPMVEIDKPYAFETPTGDKSLLDLFEGRSQLIVYHFMFGPDWEEGCPNCSLLVDNIGHLAHLHSRDTTLTVVSRAPLEKIEPFKKRMGWSFPWYSSSGSDFNYDFHATFDESVTPIDYNYRTRAEHEQAGSDYYLGAEQPFELHGLSVFLRDGSRVFHTYSTYARGPETLIGTYHYLDLTPLGRQEEEGGVGLQGFRHHDKYDSA